MRFSKNILIDTKVKANFDVSAVGIDENSDLMVNENGSNSQLLLDNEDSGKIPTSKNVSKKHKTNYVSSNKIVHLDSVEKPSVALNKTDIDEMDEELDSGRNIEIMNENPDVTLLKWVQLQTRVIDLSVFHENEADSFKKMLSEVPFSTQLSVIRDKSNGIQFKDHMLQITVQDRIIIFDIKSEVPQEIFFLNATNQFIDPEKYADPGIKISYCKKDNFLSRESFLFTEIRSNRNKDLHIISQERKVFKRRFNWKNVVRTNVCLGIFKGYAEVDLQELSRVVKRLKTVNKVSDIDLQTVLSTFRNHTIFSIFNNSVAVHE